MSAWHLNQENRRLQRSRNPDDRSGQHGPENADEISCGPTRSRFGRTGNDAWVRLRVDGYALDPPSGRTGTRSWPEGSRDRKLRGKRATGTKLWDSARHI